MHFLPFGPLNAAKPGVIDFHAATSTGDGVTELGIRLNKRSAINAELRRLNLPPEEPAGIQLQLDQAIPAEVEIADTDVAEAVDDVKTNPNEEITA